MRTADRGSCSSPAGRGALTGAGADPVPMRTRTLASMMLLAVATASAAPRAVAVGPGTYRPVFPTSPGEAEVVVAG